MSRVKAGKLRLSSLPLAKSGSSIQETAYQLGFTDQTYFSHFYKKQPASQRSNIACCHGKTAICKWKQNKPNMPTGRALTELFTMPKG